MNTYLVRTGLDVAVTEPADVRLLDWAPSCSASTISTGDSGPGFFKNWRPPRAAADLMLLGASVYCADKTSRRRAASDSWTRDFILKMPVADVQAWQDSDLAGTLDFLTGDHWQIHPYQSSLHPFGEAAESDAPFGLGVDAVCLFSGGLDSVCGVVDLLEDGRHGRICLLSHNEGGQASTAQKTLFSELTAHYGADRLIPRVLYLRPAPKHSRQARPLPRERENTTRSRSLLFLSTALALAAAEGPDVPVYVPENGFIGINVPLTRARTGSASTRTTHPHFMSKLEGAAGTIGVANQILNPYRLRTKGEILAESRNPELLRRLAPISVSCSHPEAARHVGKPQGNCGYCFPCLIRRASLAHVGWDDDFYSWEVLSDETLLNRRLRRGADLRAVLSGVFADRPDRDVLRNGPLPAGERAAFIGVWRRGLAELRSWLTSGSQGELARLTEKLT